MSAEFRITVDADGKAPEEELLNTLKKMKQKAEYEHGIDVTVERIETTKQPDVSDAFTDGGNNE
jgi:hypothetical protein